MTKSISYKAIEKFINETEDIKPDEKINFHRNLIEEMLRDGYSEKQIWHHFEIELNEINDQLKESIKRQDKLQKLLSRDPLTFKNEQLLNEISIINNKQKSDLKLLRRSFKHFQIQYCKSIQPDVLNDKASENESNALDEEIKKWVEKNIPSSSNKSHYLEAFKIVLSLENPNDMSQVAVADEVFSRFEPNFKHQALRKKIKPFLNTFDSPE